MLREAKERMLRQQSRRQEGKKDKIKAFLQLQKEIDKIASRYAREYIGKSPNSQYESLLALYRVLIIPEANLQEYFLLLSPQAFKREFRQYTIKLHPDKNSHPKAKDAF